MNVRVVPGAEPFAFDGGDTGVLLLHGFTGNPASMRPMGDWLADRGHTVVCPRYPGHGTTWKDLGTTRWEEWVQEAEEGLATIRGKCSTVVAAGLSMGGAMALHLAANHPGEIDGIVAVNAYLRDRRHAAIPAARIFLRTYPGVGNDIKRPGQDELPYDKVPLSGILQLARFLKTVRGEIPSVRQPLLVFNSPEDHVVPKGTADYLMREAGSGQKELVLLPSSFHVATLDNDAETIFKRTDELLRQLAAS
jgi:carboxylesterase